MRNRILMACLCVLLASCARNEPIGQNPRSGGVASVHVVQANALPAPERADLLAQNRPYLIGPFDKLTIDVFGMDELSKKEIQTDAGGRISFPLAGTVDAAGRTPAELASILEERLRGRYIRDPQVTVNLVETVSQVVTVDGQVREPGLYPVVGRMTLMRAIATAKGLDEFAKLDDVVIFRTVNGQKLAALYNLRAIRRGAYEDPEIFAQDVVIVGDSSARRLFKNIVSILPIFVSPLIIALQ